MAGLHQSAVALLLAIVANTAPWASGQLLRGRWDYPIDAGLTLPDGKRLLGSHKTWRGLISGELACILVAWLCGLPLALGAEFAALSLAADAGSSFLKRRLSLPPGAEMAGLDQLPEVLLPLCLLAAPLGLSVVDAVAVGVVFFGIDRAVHPLRRRLECAGSGQLIGGVPGAVLAEGMIGYLIWLLAAVCLLAVILGLIVFSLSSSS